MKLLIISIILLNYFTFSQDENSGEFSTFDRITLEMTKDEVIDLISDIDYQEYNISSENNNYNIFVCKRHTFMESYTPFYEFFIISFSKDKTLYWGRISDFKSNENETISKLGEDISDYFLKNEVE